MPMEIDEKNLDTAIEKLKTSNVLAINKKHILGFVKDSAAADRSKKRLYKYITVLTKIDSLLAKDFIEASKKDIQDVVIKINDMKNIKEVIK